MRPTGRFSDRVYISYQYIINMHVRYAKLGASPKLHRLYLYMIISVCTLYTVHVHHRPSLDSLVVCRMI